MRYGATISVHGLSGFNGAPPTTTGVQVLRAGASAGAAGVPIDAGVAQIAVAPSPFAQGDVLDVQVDFGTNGNHTCDSTGVDIVIQAP